MKFVNTRIFSTFPTNFSNNQIDFVQEICPSNIPKRIPIQSILRCNGIFEVYELQNRIIMGNGWFYVMCNRICGYYTAFGVKLDSLSWVNFLLICISVYLLHTHTHAHAQTSNLCLIISMAINYCWIERVSNIIFFFFLLNSIQYILIQASLILSLIILYASVWRIVWYK